MRALIFMDIQIGIKMPEKKISTTENELSKHGILIQQIDNLNSN